MIFYLGHTENVLGQVSENMVFSFVSESRLSIPPRLVTPSHPCVMHLYARIESNTAGKSRNRSNSSGPNQVPTLASAEQLP